ncbi:MAG: hypothetical protein H6Q67_1998 [Firmicutes bacterium]|nr:hypothetical protein [Bacillota bacterium]
MLLHKMLGGLVRLFIVFFIYTFTLRSFDIIIQIPFNFSFSVDLSMIEETILARHYAGPT